MALGGQQAAATAGGQPIIIQGLQPQQLNFQGAQLIQAQLPQLATNQIFINASQPSTAPSPMPGSASTPTPQQQQQHQQQLQSPQTPTTIHLHQANLGQATSQQQVQASGPTSN